MNLRRRHPGAPAGADPDSRWWSRAGSFVLWYTLPALAIAIVGTYIALAILWHSNPPVVPVTGRSMQPALHAGDLVFIKGIDPRTLRRGDIIAFKTTKASQQKYGVPPEYVHRIYKVSKSPAGYQFATKGDNVPGPDPFTTFQNDVIGEYNGKIAGAGYPVLFFRSRQGMIFGAAVVVVLLLYFVFGFWERRQEALESNALTMEQIVDEARALRDSMVATAVGPPPAPAPAEPTEAPPPPAARAEPSYVPQWERPPAAQLAEFELAPAYREPQVADDAATLAFTPIPNSRALVPYVPPAIDFDRLEREIHDAVRSALDVRETMEQLVGAIGEYGEHLRSHTAVVQNLAETTGELKQATGEMRTFLASLTALLTQLVEQSQPRSEP